MFSPILWNLILALGAGLLIGAERERRKAELEQQSGAGVRTFSVAALAGAIATAVGGVALLAVATVLAAGFAAMQWLHGQDRSGITTELALVLTVLLGGLAMTEPAA